MTEGRGDGSVRKVLVTQALGPATEFQKPHKKRWVAVHTGEPSASLGKGREKSHHLWHALAHPHKDVK